MSSAAVSSTDFTTNLRGLWRTMRPHQWTKNAVVYAALIFDGKLFVPELFARTTILALCFCLLSSSVYILNDLADIEKDRRHPRKQARPLPSGGLNPRFALVASIVLALMSLSVGVWVNVWAGLVLMVYLAQNVAYSFWLKDIVIIDVMVLSLGFLLRVVAGVIVVDVENFSPWLYVCVALLALFLALGKRRQELVLLETDAHNHRSSLGQYSLELLDQLIVMVTTSILIAYTLYTFEAPTALVGGGRMLLTVPFVFYFLARYLYLIHVRKLGGAPDELLLEDRPLLINTLLWGLTVVALIYFAP
ncbi:MAG: decaprenyl-phosphate phosphoribosyltransferase [Caldilineaceae bacterium]